jgi:TrfA protein
MDKKREPELSPELGGALDSLKRTFEEKEKTRSSGAVQLPLWTDPERGVPNPVVRSALFSGIHSKRRKELGVRVKPTAPKEAVTVAAQKGSKIAYAGDQLNQYDADVFFEALHRARMHPLETECFFRGHDFLRAIGRSDSALNYEDLNESLTRLRDGRVEITWTLDGREFVFVGGLVASFAREKESKLYKISFSKDIRRLFEAACWTKIEWEERQALNGHPLAQWLHSFLSTHAKPLPLSPAYLHEISGSATALVKHFRADLKKATQTLQAELGWVATWDKKGCVTVERPPSSSQARHLVRKARREALSAPKGRRKRGEDGLTRVDGDLFQALLKAPKTPR